MAPPSFRSRLHSISGDVDDSGFNGTCMTCVYEIFIFKTNTGNGIFFFRHPCKLIFRVSYHVFARINFVKNKVNM